ncbi:MAG: methionyl-tRNA formyltransferase, partial [Bacteroidaceae bacterium]|nr:methionyl-tRNA formyltransferase [Bacteroidaceae bacterium]
VYMGTPDFAVESLRALVEGGYNVVGVVTMPDKPMGRHGSVLQPSPVKKYALEKGLTVLQPEKLKDETFLDELRALKADLQIVVAFRMLPEVVWNMPPMGTFNLHASLLPQYRGAAPINWAVINGETETGITTLFLKHEIDTGKIIQQVRVPIHETDNVEDVHDRLMLLGGQLVTETVDNILAGTIQPIDQSELVGADVELKPAPKIFHETCQINWNQPMKKVYDFIRGLSPYPAAWSEFEDAKGKKQSVKIFSTSMVERVFTASELMPKPGEMLTDGKTYLHVMCQNGLLSINELQMAGKKRMPIADFLRGFEMKERMAFIASDC